jgi:starch-binding outer membrane protein, SusD/RagB family
MCRNRKLGLKQGEAVGGVVFRSLVVALSIGGLSGCDLDTVLNVEAPDQITEDALTQAGAADLLVNSAIAQFECGYSGFMYDEAGKSDTFDRIAGAGVSGSETYLVTTDFADLCSDTDIEYDWGGSINLARRLAISTYEDLSGWTDQQVASRERKMATVAVYGGAALGLFGEFFCEYAIDGGPLMRQEETLALAEEWVTRGLDHIARTGDFEIPHGATNSIETLAYGLRARIRWAQGPDRWDDALADALRVPQGYTAWVTRENAPTRWNNPYHVATKIGFALVNGPITHWDGPPNPVTGETWQNPIPFTGYLDLGILPDGRAISDDQNPITTTAYANAVMDQRVQTRIQPIQGPTPGPVPVKYLDDAEDLPLVGWDDMWLIRAEIEGGQGAIDRVNEVRSERGLPLVTYVDPNNADQVLDMIIEERRRELWIEGRFWSTKIQHTDRLWFPRNDGNSRLQGFIYGGAVTLIMPEDEYELNQNFDLSARGTGCAPSKAPTIGSA